MIIILVKQRNIYKHEIDTAETQCPYYAEGVADKEYHGNDADNCKRREEKGDTAVLYQYNHDISRYRGQRIACNGNKKFAHLARRFCYAYAGEILVQFYFHCFVACQYGNECMREFVYKSVESAEQYVKRIHTNQNNSQHWYYYNEEFAHRGA